MIRTYPLRAFILWFALHAFVAAASEGAALAFSTSASIAIVVIAAGVGFVDTHRRHEVTMLGNLGIPASIPPALWAGTALVLEVILRTVIVSGRASG